MSNLHITFILVSAKQQGGKSSTVDMIESISKPDPNLPEMSWDSIVRVKFADPLYAMKGDIYSRIHQINPELAKRFPLKDKTLLQALGKWGRGVAGQTIFADLAIADLAGKIAKSYEDLQRYNIENEGREYDTRILALVDDLRFVNEFHAPERLRDVVSSLTGVDVSVNTEVYRFRIECPEEIRKARNLETWRENSQDISETDLDQYAVDGKFDCTFWSDTMSASDLARKILHHTDTARPKS